MADGSWVQLVSLLPAAGQLLPAAGQLIFCGLDTNRLTCVHSEGEAEGAVVTRGILFLMLDHQSTSGSSFKASIHVLSITPLWPNQVTWPSTESIGQRTIYPSSRASGRVVSEQHRRQFLSETEEVQADLKFRTEI